MIKVYINIIRKTQSMTRNNIVVHQSVSSPQIREQQLIVAQQHSLFVYIYIYIYTHMIKETHLANNNTIASY
jgi:hypothetical protein